jgi:serine/threonine protein kinase
MKSNNKRYGFRINSRDFYVSSAEELDMWMEFMRKKCILNSFDDDFVKIKEIGKGSTATVWMAEELHTRKKYAVKTVNKEHELTKEEEKLHLANEIRILRQLDHPNVAKLFYVYEDSTVVYMVMEYLPFGDLFTEIRKKDRFSEEVAQIFVKKLIETLDFLHTNGIVHRDLKLENIIMACEHQVDFKLIDFGLSYMSHATQSEKCGSPGYMAPEIMYQSRYDNKIDIFSAGVILYIILTGRQPFTGKSADIVLRKNIECNYKLSRKLSAPAKDLIRLMMQPDPEKRPSASQLLEHPWFALENSNTSGSLQGSI